MRQGQNTFRLWRRYHVSRWTVGVGLVALLVSSLVAGGFIVRAQRTQQTSAHPKTLRSNPKAASQWFQLSHFGSNGIPSTDALIKARQQTSQMPVSRFGVTAHSVTNKSGTAPNQWTALGPAPIDSTTCPTYCGAFGANTGRVTAIAVSPGNSNSVWVGAADGGLWHSTDGGSTWSVVSDNSWPTQTVGSIAIDPNNANHIFVGTGEANLNGDAFWGAGVMESTDGGAHWTQYGFAQFGGLGIARIAVDPNNGNNVLLATSFDGATIPTGGANLFGNMGIWRSTDGGHTWSQVLHNNTNSSNYFEAGTEVLFDPAHSGVVYSGIANVFGYTSLNGGTSIAGIYKSTNNGATWVLLSGAPYGIDDGRITLGISADGQKLWGLISATAASGATFGNLLSNSVFHSTDAGATWTAVPASADMQNDSGGSQWWYDDFVGVDPTDATGNTVYFGGVDVWDTTNGGTNWTNLTNVYQTSGATSLPVHPDEHALAFFSPTSSSFYIGNDGGVWNNIGGTFNNKNSGGLNITQFYGGSVGEVGSDQQLYGGAQDNGESQFQGAPGGATGPTGWHESYGGDGGQTAVDYTNNANVYEEYVYLNLSKSVDGGVTWNAATTGINEPSGTGCTPNVNCDPVNFIAPFVMSPDAPNILIAGTDQVYITTTSATSWNAVGGPLDGTTPLSALAIGPNSICGTCIYAGDNNGNIYYTPNQSAWTGGAVPGSTGGMVTGLALDPTNPNVVYATFADFANGSGHHVFKSTNHGGSWTDISGSLPNTPFESILVNPANHNMVIAGSDTGVFVSMNGGSTWAQMGTGLPNVPVDQIFTNHTGTELYVATHGRGMWILDMPHIATSPTSFLETTPVNTNAAAQTFTLSNPAYGGTLNWTASNLPSWVANVTPSSGSLGPGASQQVTINYNTSGISSPQTLNGSITITAPGADNSPYTVPIQIVVENISKTWYFAEGHTGDSFTEYLTLENPNNTSTSVTVNYLLSGGRAPITKTYSVGANARATITVNNEIGAPQDVSMVVTGTQPIVAERPIYFTYTGLPNYTIPGGTDVLGATALNSSFDFGYLDTSTGHDTWLTILNQNSSAMDVHVSYYPAGGGAPITRLHTVVANSRGTIHVNNENLPAGSYSALISLTQSGNSTAALGLVERPLYLVDSATGDTGSADVVGVSTPLSAWYFAEGYTGPTFSERYILSNPNASSVSATVTFYLAGGTTRTASVSIPAGGQQVVNANAVLGSSVNNSAVVTSTGGPILAERFMSFNYTGAVGSGGAGYPGGIQGASDVLGAAAPAQLFEFAEGYSGGQFGEYLTLENPNAQSANVTVRYLPQSGASPTVVSYVVPAHSRYTVFTNAVMPNQSFSMEVLADAPIVAERPMYFNFTGGGSNQTGGSDVIGYAP